MSAYLVLARKYRPQNFNELVGQEVLVRTLTNAIKNNRLHHAYILHGIRGVGKTTTARIIAKTLNCLDVEYSQNGQACGKCDNCMAIAASRHQDVFEIDAASRTGVDDVRQIIDSIAYAPVLARYKIYIIDEFHMMSDSAFNALLKTLEEPPANVKFIFATTEIRQVPQTILSRCQRFDLRRLDEGEIVEHLKNILKKEAFDADIQALNLIAKASEGSVRDSLSMLDQALASNNHQQYLNLEVVEKMFGLADRSKVIDLLESLLQGDFVNSLSKFKDIYALSSDILQIAQDLLEIIHKISALKLVKEYQIDSYSKLQIEKLDYLAKNTEIVHLIRIWQLISKSLAEINYSASSRLSFEMLMIKICHLIALPDLKNVLVEWQKNRIEGDEIKIIEKPIINPNIDKSATNSNNVVSSASDIADDLVAQILKTFEGAKIV